MMLKKLFLIVATMTLCTLNGSEKSEVYTQPVYKVIRLFNSSDKSIIVRIETLDAEIVINVEGIVDNDELSIDKPVPYIFGEPCVPQAIRVLIRGIKGDNSEESTIPQ